MLLSMTGFGDAQQKNDVLSVSVELRTVNNKYLKVSIRGPEGFGRFESLVEKLLRGEIARGTVNIQVRLRRLDRTDQYRLDDDVLKSYWEQVREQSSQLGAGMPASVESLLALPGVISDSDGGNASPEQDWPIIEHTIRAAIEKLNTFRRTEGESTQSDLEEQLALVTAKLSEIETQAPSVATSYRDRLLERVRDILTTTDVDVDADHLIREVSIFSERCDINEEITRLRSHVAQFQAFFEESASQGRKLEFLCQEIFREVNTIGSKANDVEIAHAVVEMKAAVEKMREILQNVE